MEGDGLTERGSVEGLEVELLLEAVRARYGYDFRGYQGDSIRRRLLMAQAEIKAAHLGELQHRLLHEPSLFAWLISRLTVQVSEMFRDPSFYLAFRQRVVPLLHTYPELKFWHAGAAAGEEAYSMAILLTEHDLYERSQIYVTDLDHRALAAAKEGIYPEARAAKFQENYRLAGGLEHMDRYLTRGYGHVTMRDGLRRNMVFFQHDLASDGAFGEMNAVFCRNVLIYFGTELRQRALDILTQAVRRGGFLCLGSSETLSAESSADFDDFLPRERIYRSRGISS